MSNQPDPRRRLSRETILKCYRRFVCPEAVDAHTSIYSEETLWPELFGSEPPYDQVISTGPRSKRPLSDLIDKCNAANRPPARPRDPNPFHNDPSVMIPPQPRNPNPGLRRMWDTNEPERGRSNAFGTKPSDTPVNERFAALEGWTGRGAQHRLPPPNHQPAPPPTGADRSWDEWRGGNHVSPHTQDSWERLDAKLAAAVSPSKIAHVGNVGRRPAQFPPVNQSNVLPTPTHPSLEPMAAMGGVRRDLMMKGYGQGDMPDDKKMMDMLGPAAAAAAAPRPPLPSSQQRPPPQPMPTTTMTYQELLQKMNARRPESHEELQQHHQPRAVQQECIVRWTDARPLYIVESIHLGSGLANARIAALQAAETATSAMEARSRLEHYETRVCRVYADLLESRQISLPPPLAQALKVDESTSLALWPTFRELYLQSTPLLGELQAWEESLGSEMRQRGGWMAPNGNVYPPNQYDYNESVQQQQDVRPISEAVTYLLKKGGRDDRFDDFYIGGAGGQSQAIHGQPPQQPPPRPAIPQPPLPAVGQAGQPAAGPVPRPALRHSDVSCQPPLVAPPSVKASHNMPPQSPKLTATDIPSQIDEGVPTSKTISPTVVAPPAAPPVVSNTAAQMAPVQPTAVKEDQQSPPARKAASVQRKAAAPFPPAAAPPPSTVVSTGDSNWATVKWEYLDPSQNVQGPFSSSRMFGWWQRDYFPPDLPVRFRDDAPFVSLSSLYPPESNAQPFKERPPKPQPVEPERTPTAFVTRHDVSEPPVSKGAPAWKPKAYDMGPTGGPLMDPSVDTQLGPSLAESRFSEMTRDANPGVKGARKKAKGKKQALSEILSEQQAVPPKSVWAPVKAVAWPDAGRAPAPVVEPAAETTSPTNVRPEGVATTSTLEQVTGAASPVNWAKSVAAPIAEEQAISPKATVSAVPPNPPPQASPVSSQTAAPASMPSGPPPPAEALNAVQRQEVNRLCQHHKITIDPDMLDVLIYCQSATEMSSLLRDNKLVRDDMQCDAFVEDFWDLVRNPFKPVKKGVVNNPVPKSAKRKGSKRK